MIGFRTLCLLSTSMAFGAHHASAVILEVDPDGDGTPGGSLAEPAGSRVANTVGVDGTTLVETFVDDALFSNGRVLYIGFNLESLHESGVSGFFHGAEFHDGATNDASRVLMLADEADSVLGTSAVGADSNLALFVNDFGSGIPETSQATSLGLDAQQHNYIIKIESVPEDTFNDLYSLYVDPSSTVESEQTPEIDELTGGDTFGITDGGFGSFVNAPPINYSNLFFGTTFDEVADALLGSSTIPGDTDGDGDIDDFDLLNAISNFTGSLAAGTGGKGAPEGDTDADADVDDFDLLTMISGFTGSLSAPHVPEPASAALLGLGGLLIARRRRG